VVLVVAFASCAREPSSAPVFHDAPVVLISIDTLRSDRLPAYGYTAGATPAIDRLRRDGILAARAYTHAPLTLPAHVSLLSGLLPPDHGVRDNLGYAVPATVALLPQILGTAGYSSGAAVSAAVLRRSSGIAAGFETWDEPGGGEGLATDRAERPGAETLQAIEPWLRRVAASGGERFFLFFHLYEPHAPYRPPPPFADRFASPYDGEVAAADAAVGALLGSLDALDVYDRALIILLSDHGEGLGDHGEQEHGVFLYREALQVPLLLKLPGARRAGTTIEAPAQLIDVAPTVLALLGVEAPANLAGRSLLELDANAPPASRGDRTGAAARQLYAETFYPRLHFGWSELRSIIAGNLHFIEAPIPELYDLAADPAERVLVLDRERAAARALRAALEQIPRTIAEPVAESSETERRLAALGYLGGGKAGEGGSLPDPKTRLADLERLEESIADRAALDEGLAAAAAGNHDRAISLLEPIAQRGDGAAMVALATAFSDAGRQREARAWVERALATDDRDARAHETLGLLLLRDGRAAAAVDPLRRATTLDAGRANPWNLLGVALERGARDHAGAIRAWQRALEIEPDRFDVLFNLATVAADHGDLEIARASFARFVAEAPPAAWGDELPRARERLRSLGGAP
jgi:arylsulfatase A-like enzyme/Flp pilus assembly protein TadD